MTLLQSEVMQLRKLEGGGGWAASTGAAKEAAPGVKPAVVAPGGAGKAPMEARAAKPGP